MGWITLIPVQEGPKKLLVMTSSTGGGHDSHAKATAAWCEIAFGDRVSVLVDQTLENSHQVHRLGMETYHQIQTKAPWIQHLYFQLIECQQLLNSKKIAFGQEYFVGLLEEFQPDAILSVHDCLNLGYLEVAKRTLGNKVAFATYCHEFGGGYGFSRNWVNRNIDWFFGRTDEVCKEAVRRGVPSERSLVAGYWSHPSFYKPRLSEQEKSAILRDLGLRDDRFTLLLSTGGAGAQHHIECLNALLPLQNRLQVIALCGRSEKTAREVGRWRSNHSSFPLQVISYTESMPIFLQIAAAIVARPGAATCGEVLLSQTPIIFDVIGGIMPQELPNWNYFKKRRMGHLLKRGDELPKLLESWLDRPEIYHALKNRFASLAVDPTPAPYLKKLLRN